jgi:signal transduction histidine kinase
MGRPDVQPPTIFAIVVARLQTNGTSSMDDDRADGTDFHQQVGSLPQLKSLFRRLVSVQEDERRRIARDLHDHLGQQLTALRLNLEAFRLQCGLDEAQINQLERTQRLADDLDRSIDFLTWQLRPPTLEDLGLAAALKELAGSWSGRGSLEAQFHSIGMDGVRLNREVEENLYRIAQEALNNVVKHAGAHQANVVLTRSEQRLSLLIEDDGCGFDHRHIGTSDDQSRRHLGLLSMRERAGLIDGELSVDSELQRGTTILIRVPLANLPSKP